MLINCEPTMNIKQTITSNKYQTIWLWPRMILMLKKGMVLDNLFLKIHSMRQTTVVTTINQNHNPYRSNIRYDAQLFIGLTPKYTIHLDMLTKVRSLSMGIGYWQQLLLAGHSCLILRGGIRLSNFTIHVTKASTNSLCNKTKLSVTLQWRNNPLEIHNYEWMNEFATSG